MNKSLKDLSKFMLTFTIFLGITIPLYQKFVPSKTQEFLAKFDEEKIDKICPQSPREVAYQNCFRKYIAEAVDDSRPLDFIALVEKVEFLYEKDKFTAETPQQEEIVKLYYFESWGLILDHYQTFKIERKNISFLDIFSLPYARYKIKATAKPVIDSFFEFTPQSLPANMAHRTKILDSKFQKYRNAIEK